MKGNVLGRSRILPVPIMFLLRISRFPMFSDFFFCCGIALFSFFFFFSLVSKRRNISIETLFTENRCSWTFPDIRWLSGMIRPISYLDAGRAHDVMFSTTHRPQLTYTPHHQRPARAPAPPPISTAAPIHHHRIASQLISPLTFQPGQLARNLKVLYYHSPEPTIRVYHTSTLTTASTFCPNNSRRDSRDHRSSFGGQVFRLWLSHALSSPISRQPSPYSSSLRNTTPFSSTPHALDRQRNNKSNQAGRTGLALDTATPRPTYQAHMHHCIP